MNHAAAESKATPRRARATTVRLKLFAVASPAMRVLTILVAVAAALLACNEAAPPTTTAAAPTAPVVPVSGGGSSPALPSAPAAPVAPTAPAVPVSGGGSSPALPSVVGNIVFEINAGAAPTRSLSIASLPPIDGTRQESTIISERIRKTFPGDFTYDGPTTVAEVYTHLYPWKLEQEATAITQDWLDNGGTVIPSYSLNGGTEWFSGAIPGLPTIHRWGYNESGGYVKVEMSPGAPIPSLSGHEYSVHNRYACTTTETSHSARWHDTSWTPPLLHHPTMTITEGSATATAEATLSNGVITAVGNIQHGSGTFAGTNVAYTWGTFWNEPQRGSGATFTFTVSSGRVTAVAVTNGGTGYRKPCNAGTAYTNPPSYYVDKTVPGYRETASMRAALRNHGTEPLLIRFAIISP